MEAANPTTLPSVTDDGSEVFEIVVAGCKAWVFKPLIKGTRAKNFYVKGNVQGQFYRGTGFSAKGMAADVAKRLWKAHLEKRSEVLEETKLRQDRPVASIGEVVRAHGLASEAGLLEIKLETGKLYRACLRRVVAWGSGMMKLNAEGAEDAEKGRERVDIEAVDKLSTSILDGGLVDEFVRRYVAVAGEDHLARDQRLRGAHSVLRGARAMFEEVAMKAYDKLRLPDSLREFLAAHVREAVQVEHEALDDKTVAVMASKALELRDSDLKSQRGLYLVHLLFRHLGMRNDEIENARVEWLERLPAPRAVFLPNGEQREIWALMKIQRRAYWTPKASNGDVGISADVLRELGPFLNGRDGAQPLVPARTATERWELINRAHSDFIRPFTGDRQKTSYELRRWGATKIAGLHQSEEMAERFLRHAKKTTAQKHYLTQRPIPCPITLADAGL